MSENFFFDFKVRGKDQLKKDAAEVQKIITKKREAYKKEQKTLNKLELTMQKFMKISDSANKSNAKLANTFSKSNAKILKQAVGFTNLQKSYEKVKLNNDKLNVSVKGLAVGGMAFLTGKTLQLSAALGKKGLVTAGNMAARGISLIGQRLIGLNEGFGRIIGGGLRGFTQGLSDLARGAITRAAGALNSFIKKSVSQFSELDKASREIAIFSGTVDSTFSNFGDVSKVFRQTLTNVASQTIYSSEQIAAAMSEIASIGQFETPEQLETLTETAAVLATATGADMEFAGALLARTMNAFSASLEGATSATGVLLTEEEKAVAVANVLARAANDSALSMAQLGDAMQYVSPLAVAAGVSLQESVSMVAALSNMGFNASRAGTAIAQALEALTAPSKGAADAMASIDFSAFDEQGNMKDMGTILMELKDRMSQLSTEEEKLMIMQEMFGTRAGRAMNALMNDTDQYANLLGALAKDAEDNFNLIAEANEAMMQSVAGQFSIFQGQLDGLRMAFIGALEPLLTNVEGTGLLQTLNSLISDPQVITFFETLTNTIGDLIGVVNDSAGTILTGMISVLNMLLPILSLAIEAFAMFFQDLGDGTSIFGAFASVFQIVFDVIASIIPVFMSVFQTIIPVLMPIIQQIGQVIISLLPIIQMLGDFIAQIFVLAAPFIIQFISIIQRLMPTIMGLVGSVMNLFNVLLEALVPVFEMLFTIIEQNMPTIKQLMIAVSNIIDIIAILAPVIIGLIQVALIPIMAAFRILVPIIGLVLSIFNALAPIIKILASIFVSLLVPVIQFVMKIFDGLMFVITTIANGIQIVIGVIGDFLTNIVKGIVKFVQMFYGTLEDIANKLANLADNLGMSGVANMLRGYARTMGHINDMADKALESSEGFMKNMSDIDKQQTESRTIDQILEDQEAELKFDFGNLEDNKLADVDTSQFAFPVEAEFQNLEVDQGVVQLEASDSLQNQAEKAEELFGSISNILAVQEIAGALLGTAAAGLNGEGVGNGGAGQPITDNSVTNSNNTAVESINIIVGSDGSVVTENTEATEIIASTFKKISDGMS